MWHHALSIHRRKSQIILNVCQRDHNCPYVKHAGHGHTDGFTQGALRHGAGLVHFHHIWLLYGQHHPVCISSLFYKGDFNSSLLKKKKKMTPLSGQSFIYRFVLWFFGLDEPVWLWIDLVVRLTAAIMAAIVKDEWEFFLYTSWPINVTRNYSKLPVFKPIIRFSIDFIKSSARRGKNFKGTFLIIGHWMAHISSVVSLILLAYDVILIRLLLDSCQQQKKDYPSCH